MNNYTLGISCYYHDSAMALVRDGEVIAALQEERLSRIKNDQSFPQRSIEFVLKDMKIDPSEIGQVVYYEKPFLTFERILETYHAFSPKGLNTFLKVLPVWFKDKIFIKNKLRKELKKLGISNNNIQFPSHHHSHMGAAFYPSPFDRAAILTLDGVGEWETLSFGIGEGNEITQMGRLSFPHSLGLFYSSFTAFCGFQVNNGEYKLMGLAPYGQSDLELGKHYEDLILKNLIDIKEDGSFHLDLSYFEYPVGTQMFNEEKWKKLFGISSRNEKGPLLIEYAALAYACQRVTESIILKLASFIKKETGEKFLCLGGGVALNCVANGLLLKENIFEEIWIQPASGDAGSALGAALVSELMKPGRTRQKGMKGCYLGPKFLDKEIKEALGQYDSLLSYYYLENDSQLIDLACDDLEKGKILGWFQGACEFGPRALGNRSILADPRGINIQRVVNQRVKKREGFRPFAPAICEEDFSLYFEGKKGSPYMLLVQNLKKTWLLNEEVKEIGDTEFPSFISDQLYKRKSYFPAITHVDGSSRVQIVQKITNPLFHTLIERFKTKTDCPMVLNTSFNVKDEPIVCEPVHAIECFLKTELDVLYIGGYRVTRSN